MYHRIPYPVVLICKGGLIKSKEVVESFQISQNKKLFLILL